MNKSMTGFVGMIRPGYRVLRYPGIYNNEGSDVLNSPAFNVKFNVLKECIPFAVLCTVRDDDTNIIPMITGIGSSTFYQLKNDVLIFNELASLAGVLFNGVIGAVLNRLDIDIDSLETLVPGEWRVGGLPLKPANGEVHCHVYGLEKVG